MDQAVSMSADSDRLRVIICIAFDSKAPSEKVRKLKARIVQCPNVLHSIEVSGTFDFMFEAAVPDLRFYKEKLDGIAAPLEELAARIETNFVCSRNVRLAPARPETEPKQSEIWVPCRDGRRRILTCDISKIIAERDYVRIHAQGTDCLFHCTIKEMLRRLDPNEFVHIHRSVIVRRNVVERLIHENRRWKVRLVDGSEWPVAKSHEHEVVGAFTGIQIHSDAAGIHEAVVVSAPASPGPFLLRR
jgi:DNA-binding LytR/AlgR family response regulator